MFFSLQAEHPSVLGLRFYACRTCDTVYAGPDEPPECSRCCDTDLREITDRLQTDSYFSPLQSSTSG